MMVICSRSKVPANRRVRASRAPVRMQFAERYATEAEVLTVGEHLQIVDRDPRRAGA